MEILDLLRAAIELLLVGLGRVFDERGRFCQRHANGHLFADSGLLFEVKNHAYLLRLRRFRHSHRYMADILFCGFIAVFSFFVPVG